jgi:hypothetical protein
MNPEALGTTRQIGITPYRRPAAPVHHRRNTGTGMKKKDSTEVIRVRESVERNKVPLIICMLLAIVGVVGWLSSL